MADGRCIDTYDTSNARKVIVFGCHETGGNQFIALREDGLMMTSNQDFCIGVTNRNSTVPAVVVVKCSENDESQRWKYAVEVRETRLEMELLNSSKDGNFPSNRQKIIQEF